MHQLLIYLQGSLSILLVTSWLSGGLICSALGLKGFVQLIRAGEILPALGSSLFTAATGGLLVWLAVDHFQSYGLALFLGLPIYCGILSTLLFGYARPRVWLNVWGVACLTLIFLGGIIILFALDGLICILLASPLALVMTLASSSAAHYLLKKGHHAKKGQEQVMALFLLCGTLPFLVGFEPLLKLSLPESCVVTSVEINAPPQIVWKYVPAFAPIPDRPDFLLRLGLAYPLESEMVGTGVGAEWTCLLSTGPLREKVTAWIPEQLLCFKVLSCPPSMQEISIYPNLQTPHLENFYVSQQGEFYLEPLPHGHTRLQGTSWYTNRMWPSTYWLPLSDLIVKRIHLRVLTYIKKQAETAYHP